MKMIMQASLLLIVTSIISGVFYPGLVTSIGQLLWSNKSNGSLTKNGEIILGSDLLAQPFKTSQYFWPRPSATNFHTLPSGASNFGPTNAILKKTILQRQQELSSAHNVTLDQIPIDLITASASGLDPHISVEAARLQVERIAKARNLDDTAKAKIDKLLDEQIEKPQLMFLGETRVNVLRLNLALDQRFKKI